LQDLVPGSLPGYARLDYGHMPFHTQDMNQRQGHHFLHNCSDRYSVVHHRLKPLLAHSGWFDLPQEDQVVEVGFAVQHRALIGILYSGKQNKD
jgi:hypothetical protein